MNQKKRPRGRPFPKGSENPRHLRSNRSDPNYDYKKDPNSLRRLLEESGLEQQVGLLESGSPTQKSTQS